MGSHLNRRTVRLYRSEETEEKGLRLLGVANLGRKYMGELTEDEGCFSEVVFNFYLILEYS